MRWFGSPAKAFFGLFLTLFGLSSLVVVASQIEQHIFRYRAERLLAEIQGLELRRTPWPEALGEFRHWGRAEKFEDGCNRHKCSFEIHLFEPVYNFVSRSQFFLHLDDYLRWRLRLSYQMGPFVRLEGGLFRAYMTAGGRPGSVVGSVGMREGVVWTKDLEVNIETYWSFGGGEGEYTLIADTHSVPRFHRYGSENLQLRLHPDYEIGRPGGCDTCELGWSHFTPYAAPTDVRRLMQLDLSCLTRFRPCLSQSDIMPAAWRQYLAEVPRVDEMIEQPACSSSIVETLGRDAPNVVSGEIVRPETANKRAQIKLLEKLKGVPNWKVGNNYEMGLADPTSSAIPRNSRLVFFFDYPNLVSDGQVDRGGACSPLLLNEPNLEIVRRGIDLDYTATDIAP